jgi:cytochrome b561
MFALDPMPDTPAKIGPLSVHAIAGILIAVLLVIRLIARFVLARPATANENNRFLRFVANTVHFLLYVGVIGMVISGLGLSTMANLPAVFRGEVPFPNDFMDFLPRIGHGFTATLLLALVGLHVAAALYHQFILKDNLLARMSIRRK